MQLNIIDWYILNGFIYEALLNTSALIETNNASAQFGRENIIPGAKLLNSVFDKAGRELTISILSWILIPAAIFCLYYFGHETAANWTLLPYTIYMAIYLLSLPEKLSSLSKPKQDSCDLIQKKNRLSQLYQFVSASTFNPSRIKEQIEKMKNVKSVLIR